MILAQAVPTNGSVDMIVPMLRPGDVIPGTGVLKIGGFVQTEIKYSIDFTNHKAIVENTGANPWAAGAQLDLSWDGFMIEQNVHDLITRVGVLESKPGVTDGSDAKPGAIGEYLSVHNVTGVVPAANIPKTVCSVVLPVGCWEIWGACDFTIAAIITGDPLAGAPVMPNQLASSLSVSPDTLPTQNELIVGTGVMNLIFSPLAAGQRQVLITGQCRSNSTASITLYLVAAVGSANATVKGYISARRVR
jgi:hypothetical protein